MQLFICPFCGPRAETEFHFGGDAGNLRPEGDVDAMAWSNYLYFRDNSRGAVKEIWMHLPCREVFAMERDTVTHEVHATHALTGEERP
ncbi:sarcosine oxidase subunit delta [Rhizobium miluonense]|uniref:Sarcosine oxidase subunit delta n=1 Tax=Rhizobium miluonense TaxID=411945 RepID=A0A1C3V7H8_9HYPH|nr:sarcosine oxidase subunit delta [Rhizobium miluonense]SCB23776.1 sarcosine oxidase subunit delta [Rhizobium miluonense]